MKLDPVRSRAWEILVAVQAGGDLDAALDRGLDSLPDERDRSFLAELVRGTIQWQGRYDHLLQSFVRRSLPSSPPLLVLLRLGLHQLFGMDSVPPFAAIDQASELCKRRLDPHLTGFVNGTLQTARRQVLGVEAGPRLSRRDKEALLLPFFEPLQQDPAGWIAAWHSHPRWLIQRWLQRYGRPATEAVCAHDNDPARVVLHVLAPADPQAVARDLAQQDFPVEPADGPRALRFPARVGRERLGRLLERQPCLIVQDSAVQAATAWLAATAGAPAGLPALDMCASPGGKTVHWASLGDPDRCLVAMELRAARVAPLVETLRRTGMSRIPVVLGDGRRPPLQRGGWGAVLLDGPCSGTGVIRHHPEARWRLRPQTPARQGRVLLDLALQAADLLAEGGVLMYATCSLEPQENQDVVDELLRRRADLLPMADGQGRWRRTWLPGLDGGDGFFAACLRRTASPAAMKQDRQP